MNQAILRHIGVALLGTLQQPCVAITSNMNTTWTNYKENPAKFHDLMQAKSLRDYLIEQELPIPDTVIGRAVLAALGILYGELTLADAEHYLNPAKSLELFDKLKAKLRIRYFKGDFAF